MLISAWRVRLYLGPGYWKTGVRTLDTVDSTNLRLKEWAREGAIRAPFLLAADTQTAGRGRLGRAFVSPPGTGLYMSLLVREKEGVDPGKITILAAVAVCRAIEQLTGEKPRIKWVNDLFLRGRKICGILAEKTAQGTVIGIGVNLRTPPGGFPAEAGIAGAIGASVNRECLAALTARHLLRGLKDPDDPAILDFYRARMPLIGKDVGYTQNGVQKNARVAGVAQDGGLIVEHDGQREILRCGEISLGSQSFAGLE